MKSRKGFVGQIVLSIFSFAFLLSILTGVSFAKFYCPLGYSYSPKIQLCVGKGSLKGYNTTPDTKINIFKGENHIYICPDNYTYSKKIQLCKGEGSLKGFTAQPTVKTIAAKTAKKSKNIENSKKIIKKS
ncbi:MAG: hypothetical protein M0016_05990 [Deltaproteobacteria bacterium]|jgi:hypothetical protein|nr:hypothetical protein [Deltaproteobacteria bacterium]MCL5880514.1 hypothetical protein [Deltaproteobacteria bacterium]MDA8304695.1 hypothetical protein [Deltaproteobacteria bacterium]